MAALRELRRPAQVQAFQEEKDGEKWKKLTNS
jgi:hypothetical protein